MAEPRPETMELATALMAVAAELVTGRSPNVDPASLRRAGDLLAALGQEIPAEAQPVAEIGMSDDGYKIGYLIPLRAHRLPIGTKLYLAAPPSAPVGVEGLLTEAVEVGTLCNLAAEAVRGGVGQATADVLSKGALTITRLAGALAQQPKESPDQRKAREAREANDGR